CRSPCSGFSAPTEIKDEVTQVASERQQSTAIPGSRQRESLGKCEGQSRVAIALIGCAFKWQTAIVCGDHRAGGSLEKLIDAKFSSALFSPLQTHFTSGCIILTHALRI